MQHLHLQPLYRRGPNWAHRIRSAQWPASHLYGPPVAHEVLAAMEHVREFDCRMFALYFLITETLATFVGYRISQHCLRGHPLRVISPTTRLWIALAYCALKLLLIDYAFHGSIYLIASMVIAFAFAVCSLLAIAFHFGPLQFAFDDKIIRRKRQTTRKAAMKPSPFSLYSLASEIKRFFLKQHFHEYALALAAENPPQSMEPIASVSPGLPGCVLVSWILPGTIELVVDEWNEWFTRNSYHLLVARAWAKKRVVLDRPDVAESRFVVVILPSGLIIDTFTRSPSPSLMYQLRTKSTYPFELVVRFIAHSPATRDPSPLFYYAESTKLVGSSSTEQKAAIFKMLTLLNTTGGSLVDVPLRSLRCQDFIQAQCHRQQVPGKRQRRRRNSLSSQMELAFG